MRWLGSCDHDNDVTYPLLNSRNLVGGIISLDIAPRATAWQLRQSFVVFYEYQLLRPIFT